MMIKICVLAAVAASSVDGFAFDLFAAFKPSSVLSDVSNAKMGEQFKINMDIGQKGDETHMSLNGLSVELLQGKAPKDEQVGLPGANGPHPQTSTGALALKVHSTPSFIDMFGTQKVRFEKPCYEMVWKKDMHCGSLIMGFNLPCAAKRNGVNLKAGRIYVAFPVWSGSGLAIRQAEKHTADAKVAEFAAERDESLKLYTTESNVFKKALHYRNAIQNVEKIDMTGIRYLKEVPADSEVTPVGDGLLLCKKGKIWSKEEGFLGGSHTMLGEAVLSPVEVAAETVLRP